MNASRTAWIVPTLALLCAAVAMAVSVQTLRDTPARIKQLERRQAEAAQLATLAAERQGDLARLKDRARAGSAKSPGDWIRELKPNWTVELRDQDRIPVTADWSLQRTQATMGDVNLAELDDVLQRLAAVEPPWRAVEWTLTAVDSGAGRARVVLLLEGLVHTPGATP